MDHNTGGERFVRLRLEKIGWFNVRANRPVPDVDSINKIVLKKETTGEWFVSIVVDVDEPEKLTLNDVSPEDCVGVDLGITSYIHTSDNLSVDTLDLTDEYDRYGR